MIVLTWKDLWSVNNGNFEDAHRGKGKMRRQYPGDEKDAFKWDYHNFLVEELGFDVLRVLFELTGNDSENKGHGKSCPRSFRGADEKIYALCKRLRDSREQQSGPGPRGRSPVGSLAAGAQAARTAGDLRGHVRGFGAHPQPGPRIRHGLADPQGRMSFATGSSGRSGSVTAPAASGRWWIACSPWPTAPAPRKNSSAMIFSVRSCCNPERNSYSQAYPFRYVS